jgi:hypothetical protein
MNFKLKRKAGTPIYTFVDDVYNVYENKNGNGYSYMVISDTGRPYYFDVKNDEVVRGHYLEADYWEVVKIKEDKKLDTFKVGETYLCTKGGPVFTEGGVYFVKADKSSPEPYIISNSGSKWVKHDLMGTYSEFEKVGETKPKETKYRVTMTAETPAELREKAYKLFELAEAANDARLAYGDAHSKLDAYLKEVK